MVDDVRTFDQGDPEPGDEVLVLLDYTAPDHDEIFDHDSPRWSAVAAGETWASSPKRWKGYKNGGKVYIDWPELTRRWGPLTEATTDG